MSSDWSSASAIPPDAKLEDAREWLRERARKGSPCPCCRQYAKVYRRPLSSSMAAWLIWLVRTYAAGTRWVDVKASPVRGGDYAKLLLWGLIEQKPRDPDDRDRRTSGLWRPTQDGYEFVAGRLRVPSHVYVYAGARLPVTADDSIAGITIMDALGKRFSYEKLMAAPAQAGAPL